MTAAQKTRKPKLTRALTTKEALLAGHAVFGITSAKTGTDYVFAVVRRDYKGSVKYYVNRLCGPERISVGVGTLDVNTGAIYSNKMAGYTFEGEAIEPEETPKVIKTAAWLFNMIWRDHEEEMLTVVTWRWAEHCIRCGILLTNRDSIDARMGPKCADNAAKAMGM